MQARELELHSFSEEEEMQTTTTDTRWLDAVRAMSSVIAAHRDESETQRRMARPIFDAIQRSGICDMLVPARLGGPQAPLTDCLQAIEALATLDGSTGWNFMIWAAQGIFADYLTDGVAREVLQNGELVCGAINPTGAAREVEGGFMVSGRWSFASGCNYATWLIGGCIVMDGDAPRFVTEGVLDIRVAIMPASQCQTLDNWNTAGLRGTGSHDFTATDVFVPEDRMVPMGGFFMGPPEGPDVMYRVPFYDLAASKIAAVGLGIARDAIDSFIDMAEHKVPAIGFTPLSEHHTVQQAVGRAEALLRSARLYVYETLAEVLEATQAGVAFGDDHRAAIRLASSHSARCCVEAVDLLFEAAGASSVQASSRLERCFRDVHMVTHHMMASPLNIEMVGRYLLGGPLEVRR
jgi:alkylation response protein AidB-like acyl-CoA dehydrogenase